MDAGFGAGDCERIGDGLLGQPVGALTSLAFVLAGVATMRRPERRYVGAFIALTGIGSFLAHGPRWPGSRWLHDASLAWLLIAMLLERRPLVAAAAQAVAGVGFALVPAASVPISAALAAVVIARELLRPTPAARPAFGLLATGAVVGFLSRTGGPLCRPDSLLQGHGAWHLLAAAAVWVWATPRRAG